MTAESSVRILALRAEVHEMVRRRLGQQEAGQPNYTDVVKQFSHNIGAATLERWIDEELGRLAIEGREESGDSITMIAASLSSTPAPTDDGVLQIMSWGDPRTEGNSAQHLNVCVAQAQQVLSEAEGGHGNAAEIRLKILANEHLRKCLDTAARTAKAFANMENLGKFHMRVIDAIAQESPECAQRLVISLGNVLNNEG